MPVLKAHLAALGLGRAALEKDLRQLLNASGLSRQQRIPSANVEAVVTAAEN